MSDLTDCKRKFSQLSRAWYGPKILTDEDCIDRVNIGFYREDGSTPGEFEVAWFMLCGQAVSRLTAYEDSWHIALPFSDMLEKMAGMGGKSVTPDEFCKMLVGLGIEDQTRVNQEWS